MTQIRTEEQVDLEMDKIDDWFDDNVDRLDDAHYIYRSLIAKVAIGKSAEEAILEYNKSNQIIPVWGFVERSIIAYKLPDNNHWYVVNGDWEGIVDENEDFICLENNWNAGKFIILNEEMSNLVEARYQVEYLDVFYNGILEELKAEDFIDTNSQQP